VVVVDVERGGRRNRSGRTGKNHWSGYPRPLYGEEDIIITE
jgi:hypothetical protein